MVASRNSDLYFCNGTDARCRYQGIYGAERLLDHLLPLYLDKFWLTGTHPGGVQGKQLDWALTCLSYKVTAPNAPLLRCVV